MNVIHWLLGIDYPETSWHAVQITQTMKRWESLVINDIEIKKKMKQSKKMWFARANCFAKQIGLKAVQQ